jgi:hypothetical protein
VTERRAVRAFGTSIGCSLFIGACTSVLIYIVVAHGSVLLDPDTAACKVWAEEIWRFGRAFYAPEGDPGIDYPFVMPTVPKPLVIGLALLLRPITASTWALRVCSVAAWGFSLWGLCAIWKPRSGVSGVLLVLPVALTASFINWATSAQASTLYLALVVGALVCFDRSSEGSPLWSYGGGLLLMLAGLTRPGAWLFPLMTAICLLKRGRLAKVHAVLGPCIGFLAPILWAAADYAFSGDPLWSAQTADPWLPQRSFGALLQTGSVGRVMSAVWANCQQLAAEVGYVVLVLAIAGIVPLMRRSLGTRLLALFSGAELLVFTVIVASGVGLPATRYLAVLRLAVLLAAGGAVCLCYEIVESRARLAGFVVAAALAALIAWILGGSARAELAVDERTRRTELRFTETADALSRRIREDDLLFVPLKFIPAIAERLQLYPMAGWFRDADLLSDVNATLSGVRSGWLVVWQRNSRLHGRIREVLRGSGTKPIELCQRLSVGVEIYRIGAEGGDPVTVTGQKGIRHEAPSTP